VSVLFQSLSFIFHTVPDTRLERGPNSINLDPQAVGCFATASRKFLTVRNVTLFLLVVLQKQLTFRFWQPPQTFFKAVELWFKTIRLCLLRWLLDPITCGELYPRLFSPV
jgi:hypothetical protein